ncbi:MAG: hypothetical protein ACI30D_08035 [Muribaculaceae bacterium]
MNEESVVSEETEYIDTTKLFAEQEKQGARDIYAKYTFSDRIHDYTITLKTDNTVVFEKEKGPTSYGTWKSRYTDGIKLEFNYERCPVVGGESCYISVIKDGYFYMDAQDANSKNPDMRLKLTKVQ